MINEAVEIAVALCKRFEGFYPKPYLCPAGVPTIGYGTTYYPDGRKVTLDDPAVTEEQARQFLATQIRNIYMVIALKVSPNLINHTEILGAITDFCYNLGGRNYRISTLHRRINEEDWDEAVYEIKRWNRGGGRVLKGLVRRRAAEAELIDAE